MYESGSDAAGCDSTESKPAVSGTDAHGRSVRQGTVVERLSRYGMQVMPSGFQRRSRLQRQQEAPDSSFQREPSITPAMRKKYLKELLLNASHGGFSGVLSTQTAGGGGSPRVDHQEDTDWALYPMEHAWMLSAVEGNYDTILEFISEDPHLLTRRDFISGYSVLHWLAKRGQDDTLIKLLRYAEGEGIPVNVNLRGSGGLTPLHLASMHGQYMVIKLLVGAFGANVDAMDYNGKRAWQYLKGDAPLEMKELLGTWDDEHCSGGVPSGNRNVNNNSAGAINSTPCGEEDDDDEVDGEAEDEGYFDRTKRVGSWRFGSFRKLLNSFPFLGNKT